MGGDSHYLIKINRYVEEEINKRYFKDALENIYGEYFKFHELRDVYVDEDNYNYIYGIVSLYNGSEENIMETFREVLKDNELDIKVKRMEKVHNMFNF
jgi:hypothetical protein